MVYQLLQTRLVIASPLNVVIAHVCSLLCIAARTLMQLMEDVVNHELLLLTCLSCFVFPFESALTSACHL